MFIVLSSTQINETPIQLGNENQVINTASSFPGTILPASTCLLRFLSIQCDCFEKPESKLLIPFHFSHVSLSYERDIFSFPAQPEK